MIALTSKNVVGWKHIDQTIDQCATSLVKYT